jgi:uncharacterized membrane protein YeiH
LVLGASPVFWVTAPIYLLIAVVTAIVTFFLVRFCGLPLKLLSVADAFGLAVFTVLRTQKALDMGISSGIAVVMGVMTGVVGGMIRDVLSGEIPLILRREIYATASLCGAITFCIVSVALKNQSIGAIVSVVVTLGLRLSAIKWKMSLPIYISHKDDEG